MRSEKLSYAHSRRAATLAALLALAVSFAVFVPGSANAQSHGRLTGRVEAADTKLPLGGAHVTVQGTSFQAVTGADGRFSIALVPAGRQTVRIVHLGRTPLTRDVEIAAGETVSIVAALEAVTLSPVTVLASGRATALARQQHAANIRSVVTADQMGRFPDASAPEAAQRLPGVALQRDQGEGRYVQLRGASAATTQVTVNGEQIGSSEAEIRQIALDAIPVGILSSIEVAKAITPDMDADAIGGSVNLFTKRPGAARTLTGEVAGGYAPLRSTGSGTAAATYGSRSAGGRFGWLLTGSLGERNFGSDDIEPDYDDDALAELEVRHYTLWRRRAGAAGAFEFLPNARTTVNVTTFWSELQDREQRRRLNHLVEDGELEYLHKNRLEKLSTLNVLMNVEHALARGLTLDYRLGVTRSQEDTPSDTEVAFIQEDVTFLPSRTNPDRPQPNPQGGALGGTYLFDGLSTGGTLTRNRDVIAAVNLAVPFALGREGNALLKFGGKLRDKRKDQRVTAFEQERADDVDDIVLGTTVGRSFRNNGFAAGTYPMPFTTSPADVSRFASRFASRLTEREADVEAQTEAYDLTERVIGAYLMAELNITPRLLLLPGVRFEGTRLTSDGFEFDAEAETLTPRAARNSYNNVFPMAHLRYRVGDAGNVRAAFTSTIFRPNFFDLVPYVIRDDEDVERGNPALEPVTARNFDLMFERYSGSVGVISAGVFHKRLDKPVFVVTVDNEFGGETSQPVNATTGEITGVELAFQHRLTALPGALSGLGIYGNYTWTDSKAVQPGGRETRLAGQAEHAANVGLSYEKGRFSGQVSVNRTGGYIDELGEDAEDDLYASGRTQVDLAASYFVTGTTQVFFEATNLSNAPLRTYQFAKDRVRQLEYYKPAVQVGVRWRP